MIASTSSILYQRMNENTSLRSLIGKDMKQHGVKKSTIADNFSVLKRCWNEFDCLIYEILFIQELKPSLSVQSDSIRAKVFC